MDAPYRLGMGAAIESAGYQPIRVDQKEHCNEIDNEIIAEIRRPRFLVADFTCGQVNAEDKRVYVARGGVYYEAGFAQGINMPVIWTCSADCIDYVHLIHANTTTSSGTQRRSFVVSCSIAFRQSFVEGLSCFQRSSNRVITR